MTEKLFRGKVTWFSFAFSLLVIWVHSYNAELFLGMSDQMAAVYRAEHFLGDVLGQLAVPGFFMISGYLFYRDFEWSKLKGKWKRRIKSVLVPFILWNFLYYLGYVIASRLPWMTEIVGKGVVPFSLSAAVDAVLHYTYNYVFWYLRQLILLILLAPALYPILRRRVSRVVFLAFLWGLMAADIRLPLVNIDALIYYSAAASLALKAALPGREGKAVRAPAAERGWSRRGGFLGAALLSVSAAGYVLGLRAAFVPGFVLCRLCAVAGLWLIVPGEKLPQPGEFVRYNFFLYAIHFAVVRLINKTAARLFHLSGWAPLVLFFLMPVAAAAVSFVLGKFLRRFAPRSWKLLNGGR